MSRGGMRSPSLTYQAQRQRDAYRRCQNRGQASPTKWHQSSDNTIPISCNSSQQTGLPPECSTSRQSTSLYQSATGTSLPGTKNARLHPPRRHIAVHQRVAAYDRTADAFGALRVQRHFDRRKQGWPDSGRDGALEIVHLHRSSARSVSHLQQHAHALQRLRTSSYQMHSCFTDTLPRRSLVTRAYYQHTRLRNRQACVLWQQQQLAMSVPITCAPVLLSF